MDDYYQTDGQMTSLYVARKLQGPGEPPPDQPWELNAPKWGQEASPLKSDQRAEEVRR